MNRLHAVSAAFALALAACGTGPEVTSPDELGTSDSALKKQCTQTALCIVGYQWDAHRCQCVPSSSGAPQCRTDSDCRLFSDYCTGCDCRVLGQHDKDPVCTGPGVRCFADPCGGRTAACVSGTCTLQ